VELEGRSSTTTSVDMDGQQHSMLCCWEIHLFFPISLSMHFATPWFIDGDHGKDSIRDKGKKHACYPMSNDYKEYKERQQRRIRFMSDLPFHTFSTSSIPLAPASV